MLESYSENKIDTLILRLIGKRGFFVDIGAASGNYSNTLLLEQKGWNGLCIDANIKHIYWIHHNRVCQYEHCLVSDKEEEVEFIIQGKCPINVYGLSGITNNMPQKQIDLIMKDFSGCVEKRKTVLVEDVFKRHLVPSEIDFLSLDIEGSDFKVLQSIPLDKYLMKCIYTECGFGDKENIRVFMKSKGYGVYYENDNNLLLLKDT